MTDHKISTGPFDVAALSAKIDSREFVDVTGVQMFDFGEPVSGNEASLYREMAALRSNRLVEPARRQLGAHLDEHAYADPAPYIDLATADQRAHRLQLTEKENQAVSKVRKLKDVLRQANHRPTGFGKKLTITSIGSGTSDQGKRSPIFSGV